MRLHKQLVVRRKLTGAWWIFTGPLIPTGRSEPRLAWSSNFWEPEKDRAMKNETAREMVLQTMVALLSMGLAVVSLLMGRWV
jgi:hypothetical protein